MARVLKHMLVSVSVHNPQHYSPRIKKFKICEHCPGRLFKGGFPSLKDWNFGHIIMALDDGFGNGPYGREGRGDPTVQHCSGPFELTVIVQIMFCVFVRTISDWLHTKVPSTPFCIQSIHESISPSIDRLLGADIDNDLQD